LSTSCSSSSPSYSSSSSSSLSRQPTSQHLSIELNNKAPIHLNRDKTLPEGGPPLSIRASVNTHDHIRSFCMTKYTRQVTNRTV
jgi:hypothetical protein